MTEPTVTVEMSFASSPFSTSPVWVDITDYVQAIDTHIGRDNELSTVEAGTCDIVLDNTDGRFTPKRVASPYYPNVTPRRPVRVTANDSGTTRYLFYGMVSRWPANTDSGVTEITVQCVDPLGLFPKSTLTIPYIYDLQQAAFDPIEIFPLSDGDGSTTFAGVIDPLHNSAVLKTTRTQVPVSKQTATFSAAASSIMPYGAAGSAVETDGALWDSGTNSVFGYYLDCGEFFPSGTDSGFSVSMFHSPKGSDAYDSTLSEPLDGVVMTLRDAAGEAVIEVRYEPNGALAGQPQGYSLCFGLDNTTFDVSDFGLRPADNAAYQVKVGSTNQIVMVWNPSYPTGPAIGMFVNGVGGWKDMTSIISTYTFLRKGPFRLAIGADPNTDVLNGAHNFVAQMVCVHGTPLDSTGASSLAFIAQSRQGDTPAQRINYILDQIGWSATLRDIDTTADGTKLLYLPWADSPDTLNELRAPSVDSNGLFYMNAQGWAVYESRLSRVNPDGKTHFVFDANSNTGVESPLTWEMSEDDIVNIVNVNNESGVTCQVVNQGSIDTYGPTSYDSQTRLVSQDEAIQAGYWRVNRSGDAQLRADQITANLSAGSNMWGTLAIGLSDLIQLEGLPDTAPATSLTYYVESISHHIARDGETLTWTVDFQVSPTDGYAAWILGSSTYSVLGHTTILHY